MVDRYSGSSSKQQSRVVLVKKDFEGFFCIKGKAKKESGAVPLFHSSVRTWVY